MTPEEMELEQLKEDLRRLGRSSASCGLRVAGWPYPRWT